MVGVEAVAGGVGGLDLAGAGRGPELVEIAVHSRAEDRERVGKRDRGGGEGEEPEKSFAWGGLGDEHERREDGDPGEGDGGGVGDGEDAIGDVAGGDEPVVVGIRGEFGERRVERLHGREGDGGGEARGEDEGGPDGEGEDVDDGGDA